MISYNIPSKSKNGVDCCTVDPWSPKNNLPESSSLKHNEKESRINPDLARKLGTELSPGPKPMRPSGAVPSK